MPQETMKGDRARPRSLSWRTLPVVALAVLAAAVTAVAESDEWPVVGIYIIR